MEILNKATILQANCKNVSFVIDIITIIWKRNQFQFGENVYAACHPSKEIAVKD